ncbi:adhesion G protein-coupled receptor E1-like isoform X2 [Neoarius graeffei]|uniref:adhesion G protein-coupled receptor E1-like isoform X2 n=1 Tax=Neoarius graeffei TaxID=443677 RepID=UPI00298C098C|nr:adhesion G protein-coupled receptor E1-like isoform X2 [Neoarius graeffei]
MSCSYFLFLGLLFAVLNNAAGKECPPGFEVNHEDCVDENECDYAPPICDENAICSNTNGSYYCQCAMGYQINSRKVKFTADESVTCRDINECRENKTICGSNADCSNIAGSYYCTCHSGFVASNGKEQFNASQSVTCKDTDECENNNICGVNAQCTNTFGSYYCMCNPGFVNSKGWEKFNASHELTCNDINECRENKTICGSNADCSNIAGSYYCTCHSGFVASNGQEQFNASQSVTCKDRGGRCLSTSPARLLRQRDCTCGRHGVCSHEELPSFTRDNNQACS